MNIFTKSFWKDTSERVISTAAQAAIGVFTASQSNLLNVDFKAAAAVVGTAALASFLKALVAGKVSGTVSPASLVKE